MKTKLLALIALCAVLVIAALRLLPGSERDTVVETAPTEAAAQEATMEGDMAVALEGTDGSVQRTVLEPQGLGASAVTGGLAAGEGAAAFAPESLVLTAMIKWPEGATPTADLQVYAFLNRIPSSALQRDLSSDKEAITYELHRNDQFEELEAMNEAQANVLPRVLTAANVSLVPGSDGGGDAADGPLLAGGTWAAEITLPPGRTRVFLYAAGGGFATARAIEAHATRSTVTLEPTQRAQVLVEVTSEVPGVDLAGSYARLNLELDSGQRALMDQASRESRYQVERGLDSQGTTTFEGVPPTGPLELQLLHATLAPQAVTIPQLGPGDVHVIKVTMGAGVQVAGRVVDGDSQGVDGAEVTAALPGRAFGFDDRIIRKTVSDASGHFVVQGLPAAPVILRAAKTGVLQSGRLQLDLTDGLGVDDASLSLETGKAIVGRALYADGEPAAGLTVLATFDLAHMAGPSALAATRGSTNQGVVDNEGLFSITGLGAGPFSIRIAAPAKDGQPEKVAREDGVRPGQPELELVLHPAARITGICRDDLGALLAGHELSCVRIVPGSLGDVRLGRRTATTDVDGSFAFDGLNGGAWGISLVSDTHVTPDEIQVDLDREEVTIQVVAMRSCTISGIVLDPDGQPALDVRVGQASEGPAWKVALSGAPRVQPTEADAEGKFVLLGVAPGEIQLEALSAHLAPAKSEPLVAEPGGLIENVTLRMSRGGTIEGVCFDDAGKTASGRQITIQSMRLNDIRNLSTGSDGTFKQAGLTPGRYQVVAMDIAMDTSNDADGSGMASMLKNMRMATANVVEGETEFLFLGAPPASPVEVTGKVTMAGEPFQGAMVAWLPATSGMYDKMKIVSSDDKGEYKVTLEDAGEYFIQIGHMEGGAAGQQRTSEFAASVDVGTSELERDFEMPGGAITGKVTAADGTPASGVRLSVMGAGGIRTDRFMGGSYAETVTLGDGTFEVLGLNAGTYQVMAGGSIPMNDSTTASSRVISSNIQLGKDGRVDGVDLQLEDPGEVIVTVRAAGGTPVNGASVFLRDDKGRHTELISFTNTNSAGEVTVRGLAPGRYSASARATDTASQESAYFQVSSGETADVDLLMEEGGIVLVTVKIKGDGPIPVATVQVLDSQGFDVTRRMGLVDIESRTMSDDFNLRQRRVGPLPPGRYTVTATASGGLKSKRRVTLRAGETRTLTLALR